MKLLSAPRQPFIGLALMAATGIAVAEIVPLRSTELMLAAIVLAICIVVALCWPKLAATYLIVAAGFFLLHKFAMTNTAGQQLADKLGGRPRVVTAVGSVITEQKIAPSGFTTFLFKLRSIEFEGKTEPTRAIWQVRWKGAPEFGDELKLFGTAEPMARHETPANSICTLILRGMISAECSSFVIRRTARSSVTAEATRFCALHNRLGNGCKTHCAAALTIRPR